MQNEKLQRDLYELHWYNLDTMGQNTMAMLLHHVQNEQTKQFLLCGILPLNLEAATIVSYSIFNSRIFNLTFSNYHLQVTQKIYQILMMLLSFFE